MAVKVRIPSLLLRFTDNQTIVECHAQDLTRLIAELEVRFPGIKARLCDDSGKIRRFINVFVNDEDIRFLQALETPLRDGDEVAIIPAIAGGAELSEQQIEHYSRQIILPEVGGIGQQKLLDAKVLVIGCGGLGSPCAFYLAGAGIGTIGLVDSDLVELNNLQRQIIHHSNDVGKAKTQSASEKLHTLNPDVIVKQHSLRLTSENIMAIIKDYDVVVDGSDNFPTRYLVNDACVMTGMPLVHAGILRFEGQAMTILPKQGPCYRCIFPEPPPPGLVPSCQEAGILGSVAGLLGVIQANEVLKYLLGIGELLIGKLLVCNLKEMSFRKLQVNRDKDCMVCGEAPSVTELIDYELFCSIQAT